MKQYGIFMRKEWREQIRGFKIIWVPLLFIFFGALEPLTYHFLPQIMDSIGNVPDGMEFSFPDLTGTDIIGSLTGQYQLIGILVLVLAFMGTLSGERKSGTGTLLYVRPISYSSYFLAKWTAASLLAVASVWLGYGMAMTYIIQLYEHVPAAGDLIRFLLVYGVWILFAVTLTVAASAALPTGGAAGASLAVLFLGQIIDGLVGKYWPWTPWKLAEYGLSYLAGSPDTSDFYGALAVTAGLIVLLVFLGIAAAGKNASRAKV
ncbi:ABC transporter permease [Bhargavaea cecembensis]|uniref:ABC transporter permease n=1 Tax=Bhargavaea cecembensis TaxID=394098 RepID=UPI00058BD4E8|nr:ABC transporter permease subunit [Bhargavaea cecembensis]